MRTQKPIQIPAAEKESYKANVGANQQLGPSPRLGSRSIKPGRELDPAAWPARALAPVYRGHLSKEHSRATQGAGVMACAPPRPQPIKPESGKEESLWIFHPQLPYSPVGRDIFPDLLLLTSS